MSAMHLACFAGFIPKLADPDSCCERPTRDIHCKNVRWSNGISARCSDATVAQISQCLRGLVLALFWRSLLAVTSSVTHIMAIRGPGPAARPVDSRLTERSGSQTARSSQCPKGRHCRHLPDLGAEGDQVTISYSAHVAASAFRTGTYKRTCRLQHTSRRPRAAIQRKTGPFDATLAKSFSAG
jgi:hypothetical protein